MSDNYFMKEPCKHCPYRSDVKPFLTAERGEELAYHASNPYNYFHCHKTTVSEEEIDPDSDSGEMIVTNDSLLCAGFLTLQINKGANCPDEFTPSNKVYSDIFEMIQAYENQNDI